MCLKPFQYRIILDDVSRFLKTIVKDKQTALCVQSTLARLLVVDHRTCPNSSWSTHASQISWDVQYLVYERSPMRPKKHQSGRVDRAARIHPLTRSDIVRVFINRLHTFDMPMICLTTAYVHVKHRGNARVAVFCYHAKICLLAILCNF